MSEQSGEAPGIGELAPQGDTAFASLMDALAPEPDGEAAAAPEGGDGAAAPAAPAGGADTGGGGDAPAGTPTAGDPGTGGAAGTAAAPEPGAGGAAAPGDAGAAAGAAEQPAPTAGAADPGAPDLDSSVVVTKLGELSTALEENSSKAYQDAALVAVKEEHAPYFAALEKHPRLLVGTQVPAIGKEGMETLRDTNDAREWQEAVKSILAEEVRDRASRQLDENRDFLQTVHASIELFQHNPDLIPGTKGFDTELAERFATMAKPYELRVEGKLQGYSIPVQPIIDALRQDITAQRAASAPAAASTPAAGAAAAPAAPAAPADPPQAGVTSKAGTSDAAEDFSTLFGTIGLPNLQI